MDSFTEAVKKANFSVIAIRLLAEKQSLNFDYADCFSRSSFAMTTSKTFLTDSISITGMKSLAFNLLIVINFLIH
jgi:hypothetical protein